jgi:hypothetical protein
MCFLSRANERRYVLCVPRNTTEMCGAGMTTVRLGVGQSTSRSNISPPSTKWAQGLTLCISGAMDWGDGPLQAAWAREVQRTDATIERRAHRIF